MSLTPHSLTAKVFHWGFVVVFLYALTKQLDELEELEDAVLLQTEMVFASVFLALVIIRFLYMQFTRPTALPDDTPQRTRFLARAVHIAMYVCVAMIAASGLMIGTLYSAGTRDGLWMDTAMIAHEIFVIASYYLIAGHIAAAVYHRHLQDGIWETMVPFWSGKEEEKGESG